ncbi:MAG: M20/M25/M40 family metallo-hydrolase [Candidatus Shapirobacteria bacterium]
MTTNNQTPLIKRTIELLSIPSWVDSKNNEAKIGQYIFTNLAKYPLLKVVKQKVVGNRFNVIAQNSGTIDTLIVGHIDTVQPSSNWTKNPIKPVILKNKLFGLGASDMKSGIALMMEMAIKPGLIPNTMFLFYIDEEYDFLGMKKFIAEFVDKIKPKQIISLDGNNLSITNGCRGLIEISCTVRGQSGHAARPKSGLNAINKSFQLINELYSWLGSFSNPILGPTVANLAYISGGQYQGWKKDVLLLGKQGNIIPDICQFVIDIRPSQTSLNATKVIEFLNVGAKKMGVKIETSLVRHDLGSWLTEKNNIPNKNKLPKKYNRVDQTGYIDIQFLWQTFNQTPCFTIGAGSPSVAHKPDEYVEISQLIRLEKIISSLFLIST